MNQQDKKDGQEPLQKLNTGGLRDIGEGDEFTDEEMKKITEMPPAEYSKLTAQQKGQYIAQHD